MLFRAIHLLLLLLVVKTARGGDGNDFRSELIFPLHQQHNHAPGIVECPNGDLFVSWYRGSGERTADDVAVYGAWLRKNSAKWTEPAVIADVPGFPDCNTCLWIDRRQRLWLFWPTILANRWESALTNYRVATDYSSADVPKWESQGIILLRPEGLAEQVNRRLDEELAERSISEREKLALDGLRAQLDDKLLQRLGWQPRCKPTQLPGGRILLPLYSDTFSISLMAISDDAGKSWKASGALVGFGNIQPSVLRRNDGTLVAYMRENGGRQRIRIAESKDEGTTWGKVESSKLSNPGSGLDALRLASGNWLLVYNDTIRGRSSLAVSLSEDEGKTWMHTRHLERHDAGSYHYPAVVQGSDGTIHVVYSYFVDQGKSMKHAAFPESWIRENSRK